VHRLQVDDPGLEDADTVEGFHDGLIDHKTREGVGREEVFSPEADGDPFPYRAGVGGDHVAVAKGTDLVQAWDPNKRER
jgi:hypothetical protein